MHTLSIFLSEVGPVEYGGIVGDKSMQLGMCGQRVSSQTQSFHIGKFSPFYKTLIKYCEHMEYLE